MKFCPKCKSLLHIKNKNYFCSCGYEEKITVKPRLKESTHSKDTIDVIEEHNILASYDHICKKCGFDKAEVISKGIWYSDEDECIEFVCGKCKFHEKADGLRIK